jgi:hypothetical protein
MPNYHACGSGSPLSRLRYAVNTYASVASHFAERTHNSCRDTTSAPKYSTFADKDTAGDIMQPRAGDSSRCNQCAKSPFGDCGRPVSEGTLRCASQRTYLAGSNPVGSTCACLRSRRQRQLSSVRKAVKGPSQNLARNESERDSAARVGEPAEEGEAPHRNPSRDWRWDGRNRDVRDRGRPRPPAESRQPLCVTDAPRVKPSTSGLPRGQSGS